MSDDSTSAPDTPGDSDRPAASRPGWRTGRIPLFVLVPALAAWAVVILFVAGSGSGVAVGGAALLAAGGVALTLEWSIG